MVNPSLPIILSPTSGEPRPTTDMTARGPRDTHITEDTTGLLPWVWRQQHLSFALFLLISAATGARARVMRYHQICPAAAISQPRLQPVGQAEVYHTAQEGARARDGPSLWDIVC